MDAVVQDHRWLGVGRSDAPAPAGAATEAVRGACEGRSAALVILFASESYDLEALAAAADGEAGDATVIGCSTAGEIATGGPGDAGVVAVALGGEGFAVSTAAATGIAADARRAGAEAAECLAAVADRPHQVLLLLTDGLAGDQQEIVRGAYGVVGAGVPLVGGCAGDDLKMRATHQIHGTEVMQNAVVAAALASDSPFGIGVRHGWRRVGEAMLVTDSELNRVLTIEDQPALDVYLERLDAPASVRSDPEAFTRFASTHPLGLASRRGEEHVRFVSGADFEARAIACIAEVPRGALTWFMEGDDDSVLAATDAACDDALAALGDRPPLGMLAFDEGES